MRIKGNVFSITNFIKIVLARQKQKNSDTFIIIYGSRRTGKTTIAFKLLTKYLQLKREQFRNKESAWDVPSKWSQIFEKYFACSSEDMSKKLKMNDDESVCFVDEGNDILSWQGQMEHEQRGLMQLILKTGKKKIFTIVIIPSLKLIDKNLLACAHYMYIMTGEPVAGKNTAFVFKNYENPFLREHNPFGMNKIIKHILSNKNMGDRDQFESYLMRQDRYIAAFNFREIDPKLYRLYDKLVKDPIIMSEKKTRQLIPLRNFDKLKYVFDTIIYNLYIEGNSMTRISHLVRDKFGRQTISSSTLKLNIDRICAMQEKQPTLEDEEKEELDEETKIKDDMYDILGLTLEELKTKTDDSNK